MVILWGFEKVFLVSKEGVTISILYFGPYFGVIQYTFYFTYFIIHQVWLFQKVLAPLIMNDLNDHLRMFSIVTCQSLLQFRNLKQQALLNIDKLFNIQSQPTLSDT